MPCCGQKPATATASWTVTYPNGTTKIKQTELGAKLAAAATPGATYTETKTGQ